MKVPMKFALISMTAFFTLTTSAFAVHVTGLEETRGTVRKQDRLNRKHDRIYDRLADMQAEGKGQGDKKFDRRLRRLKTTEAKIRVTSGNREAAVREYHIPEFAEGGSRAIHSRGSVSRGRLVENEYYSHSSSSTSSSSSHSSSSASSGGSIVIGGLEFSAEDYDAMVSCREKECQAQAPQAQPCTGTGPTQTTGAPIPANNPPANNPPANNPPANHPPVVAEIDLPLPEVIAPVKPSKPFKPGSTEETAPVRTKDTAKKQVEDNKRVQPNAPKKEEVAKTIDLEEIVITGTCEIEKGEVTCSEPTEVAVEEPAVEEASPSETAFVKAKYTNKEKEKDLVATKTGLRKQKRTLKVKVKLKGEMNPTEAARLIDEAQKISLKTDKGSLSEQIVTTAQIPAGSKAEVSRTSSRAN
jgi:hypothetical protein